MLLAGTERHEALAIAEKLRLAVQAIVLPINDSRLNVTISIGVAEAGAACSNATTLVSQADAAMSTQSPMAVIRCTAASPEPCRSSS